MSEYLNLTGIISLNELTNALQNGKLSEMVHMEQFVIFYTLIDYISTIDINF